jgi:hypothetical protein
VPAPASFPLLPNHLCTPYSTLYTDGRAAHPALARADHRHRTRRRRDKEDLLDAVAAAGAEGSELPPADGTWRDRTAALAGEARALLERQPSGLRRRALASPGLLRLADAALGALREAGLTPAAAEVGWRTVLAYALGSIEIEAATGTDSLFGEGLERVLDGIAPDG